MCVFKCMIPWYSSKFFTCLSLNQLRCIFYLLLYLRLNCKTIKISWFHFRVCVRMLGGSGITVKSNEPIPLAYHLFMMG